MTRYLFEGADRMCEREIKPSRLHEHTKTKKNNKISLNESVSRRGKRRLNETLFDAVLDRVDGEPYDPREFYHYINGFAAIGGYNNYERVAHEMDEGEEEDVQEAIIDYLRGSIEDDGGDPNGDNANQLYDFVRNSTWITNDRTAPMPQYIKEIHDEMRESLRRGRREHAKDMSEDYYEYDNDEEDNFYKKPRYTLIYKGYIFDGDNVNGWNSHDYDDWDEVISVYNTYKNDGIDMYIDHNEYGVTFHNGEWY